MIPAIEEISNFHWMIATFHEKTSRKTLVRKQTIPLSFSFKSRRINFPCSIFFSFSNCPVLYIGNLKRNINVNNSALLGLEGKYSCPVHTIEFIGPSPLWLSFVETLPSVPYFPRLIFYFTESTGKIYIISLSYLNFSPANIFLDDCKNGDCFNSHLLSTKKGSNKILHQKILRTTSNFLMLFCLDPESQQQCIFSSLRLLQWWSRESAQLQASPKTAF